MSDDFFYKTLMDNLYDGVYFVDAERRITYWNKGAERITGYDSSQMVNAFCYANKLNHVDENGTHLCHNGCPLAATIQDGKQREAEVYLSHADGHRVPVLVRVSPIEGEAGKIIGAVEIFSNNSAAFKMRRKVHQLEENILLDPLTCIGNRKFGVLRISAALAEYEAQSIPFGLLFFDVDYFKKVNDEHGHAAGDLALQNIANTIKYNLRGTDTCARWGGEEFIALIFDVDLPTLRRVSDKLRMLIASSVTMREDHPLRVTVSMGSTLTQAGDTLETLVARADALMYESKREGRNRVTCR